MPSPRDIAQKATRESRGKGGRARTARIATDRAEQQRLAIERAAGLVGRALDKLEGALESEDATLSLRAARDILDRVLGPASKGPPLGDPGAIEVRLAFDPNPEAWLPYATYEEARAIEKMMTRIEERRRPAPECPSRPAARARSG
jgi:hypothetical protein